MKRLLASTAVVFGLLASALPASAAATSDRPPLLNCADVTGDGRVFVRDILEVAYRYGSSLGGQRYMLLYDVNGGGQIGLWDIITTVRQYLRTCPLVETQVTQATLAVRRYRDQSVAAADGYVPMTQNIPGHGVHWGKPALVGGDFNHGQPEGLNYSAGGQLLAVFYIHPMFPPFSFPEPEGFDGDEDMWHSHHWGCQWQGLSGPMVAEEVPQADCESRSGGIWFEDFGWMLHLWNYMPNMMGRFMMENPDVG